MFDRTTISFICGALDNKPILNPGSVGCGKDGIVNLIIEVGDGLVNVTYKTT